MAGIDKDVQAVLDEFEWNHARLATEVVRLRRELRQAQLDLAAAQGPLTRKVDAPKPPEPPRGNLRQ
jgi:hypothetical protein